MKPSVYIETSIVSYLKAWPSKGDLIRVHQEVTRTWWNERADAFALRTSQFVLDEAGSGDPLAAHERLAALSDIALLEVGTEVDRLAELLLDAGALPRKAYFDALHVAVAAANDVEFLATWNCRHLANVLLWNRIEQTCTAAGYRAPRICTPLELMGAEDVL